MATKQTPESSAASVALFEFALKTLNAACGGVASFIMSPNTGDKAATTVAAVTPGAEALFVVPYAVKGLNAPIDVPVDQFSDAVKTGAKKNAQVKWANNALVVGGSKFEARINCVDVDAAPKIVLPADNGEATTTIKLTPEVAGFFNSRLAQLRIDKTIDQSPDIVLIVKVRGGKAQLITYERYQFCVWSGAAEGVPDMDIAVPYARFTSLLKDLPFANCQIVITPDFIVVKSAMFRIRLALPATDPEDTITPVVAYQRVKELVRSEGDEVALPAQEMKALLESARSIVNNGTQVLFTPAQAGVTVSVESAKGSVRAQFPVRVADGFALDYRYVNALLTKNTRVRKQTGGDDEESIVSFLVVGNGSLIVSRHVCTYIAALGNLPSTS